MLRDAHAGAGGESAAAVEMLNVLIVPPPVPQVSTSSSGRSAGRTTIACEARARPPRAPRGVSPFTRRPTSSAAICAGVASPASTMLNARVSSSGSARFAVTSDDWTVREQCVGAGLTDTERLGRAAREAARVTR